MHKLFLSKILFFNPEENNLTYNHPIIYNNLHIKVNEILDDDLENFFFPIIM